MFYFLVLLFFVAGFIFIVRGFGEVREEEARSVATRLSARRSRVAAQQHAQGDLSEHEREFARREEARAAAARKTKLPTVTQMLSSSTLLNRLDEDLFQARSPMRASELLSISVLLCLFFFIVLYWKLGIFALFISLGFLFLPWLYVRYLRAKYLRSFEEQLADTLLLMANGLRAGFSFLQSMEMISRESPPPMSDEFGRVIQEVSIGVPINDALQNLATRINSTDLDLMMTAVIIQREVGGGLAEILETIALVISERMRIRREIKVLTTQGKWSGGILACLPIILAVLIHFASKAGAPNDPSFIEPMFYDPRGQIMLICAVCLQIMGFAIIMRIVSIRV